MCEQIIPFEQNECFKVNILKIEQTRIHYHPNALQIILVLKGNLLVKVAYEVFNVEEGEFLFIDQGAVHILWSETETSIVEVASLNIKLMTDYYQPIENIRFRNRPFKGSNCQLKEINKIREKTFKRYLVELYSEHKNHSFTDKDLSELIQRLITLAVYEFNYLYYIWPDINFISSEKLERFYRTVDYIKRNLSENIHLDNIAKLEGVGKSYFTNMWKEITGLSFGDYVNYERVLFSEHLLLFTDKTIITISEECGFSDVKYYYKTFKRWYGDKPLTWKANWLKFQGRDLIGELDHTESRELLEKFYSKHLVDTKLNTRIYEQYLILSEIDNRDVVKDLIVTFDLFSLENVTDWKIGEARLPEWNAIDLFFMKVYKLGLNLQIRVKIEALKVQAYKEGFDYFLKKSEQYYGLKEMKSWEFQFLCKDLNEIFQAQQWISFLDDKLNGAKASYILL